MNRSRAWRIEDTDYPAVRRVMGPRRDTMDDPALEEMLVEMFPGAEPEDVEGFMSTLQKFGKQVAPLAQKALPGVIKGAVQGVAVGGPVGAVLGAVGAGTAGVLRPQRPPVPPPPRAAAAINAPSPVDAPAAAPPIAAPAAPPPASPAVAPTASPAISPPAIPTGATADAVAQLLLLLSRRETIEGLLALLMAAAGRTTVQVGERSVPPTEFANALAETASIIAEMSGFGFQDGFSESLLDDQGGARCDLVNPTDRARLLVTDLAELAQSEAAYDEDEEDAEEYGRSWTPADESYDDTDPLEGYEDALQGRAFDDD